LELVFPMVYWCGRAALASLLHRQCVNSTSRCGSVRGSWKPHWAVELDFQVSIDSLNLLRQYSSIFLVDTLSIAWAPSLDSGTRRHNYIEWETQIPPSRSWMRPGRRVIVLHGIEPFFSYFSFEGNCVRLQSPSASRMSRL